MIAADGPRARALPHHRLKHEYLLMFRASKSGLAKRVELVAADPNAALEMAIDDRARRVVDIWQDGEFLCRISRETNCRERTRRLAATQRG